MIPSFIIHDPGVREWRLAKCLYLKCGPQLAHFELEMIRFHVRTRARPPDGLSVSESAHKTGWPEWDPVDSQ